MREREVEGLRPSVEALDRVSAAVELAQRALVGARADVDAADRDLDEELAILDFNLLQSVGRNRKAAAIRAAREELDRRLAAYRQALDDLNAARTAERQARIDAGDAYRIAYAELIRVFPQNLRKVRSFFQQSRPVAGASDEPPEPGPIEPEPVVADAPTPS